MFGKVLHVILSVAIVVTQIGCYTNHLVQNSGQEPVQDQLRHFKKGDSVILIYIDSQGKQQKIDSVIKEISAIEIILWGDLLEKKAEPRIPINQIVKIDFSKYSSQKTDNSTQILRGFGYVFIGVVILYFVSKAVQNIIQNAGPKDFMNQTTPLNFEAPKIPFPPRTPNTNKDVTPTPPRYASTPSDLF